MPTPARALSVAGNQRSRRISRRRAAWLLAAAVVAMAGGVFGFAHWKPRHGSFAVAVVPFFGPDAESEREGRMLASMIEGELLRRLPEGEVDVLGLDETRAPVRSARAAKALADRMNVDVVVWGEAFALGSEVELAPRVTRRDGSALDLAAQTGPLATGASGAIEARRARATAVAAQVAQLYQHR
jgi:hypothetical protein